MTNRLNTLLRLSAWDIQTKKKLDQDLAFPALYSLVEDKLVIVPVFPRRDDPVCVWDLSSNHFQKIGTFSSLSLYHVNTSENLLVLFEINWEKQPPEVQQSKWTISTGQLREKKIFHLQMPHDCGNFTPNITACPVARSAIKL